MKSIFLDIDGVLQPYDNQDRFDHDMEELCRKLAEKYQDDTYISMDKYDVAAVYYDWDENAVKLFKECLEETGAKIVISSGWREFNDHNKMNALLRIWELDKYLEYTLPKGRKEDVIKQYLDDNKDIDGYAVLDDYDMSSFFGVHMIGTRDRMNINDKKRMIDVLNGRYTEDIKGNVATLYDYGEPVGEIRITKDNIGGKDIGFVFLSGEIKPESIKTFFAVAQHAYEEMQIKAYDKAYFIVNESDIPRKTIQGGYRLDIPEASGSFFPTGGIFGRGYEFLGKNRKALETAASEKYKELFADC